MQTNEGKSLIEISSEAWRKGHELKWKINICLARTNSITETPK